MYPTHRTVVDQRFSQSLNPKPTRPTAAAFPPLPNSPGGWTPETCLRASCWSLGNARRSHHSALPIRLVERSPSSGFAPLFTVSVPLLSSSAPLPALALPCCLASSAPRVAQPSQPRGTRPKHPCPPRCFWLLCFAGRCRSPLVILRPSNQPGYAAVEASAPALAGKQ